MLAATTTEFLKQSGDSCDSQGLRLATAGLIAPRTKLTFFLRCPTSEWKGYIFIKMCVWVELAKPVPAEDRERERGQVRMTPGQGWRSNLGFPECMDWSDLQAVGRILCCLNTLCPCSPATLFTWSVAQRSGAWMLPHTKLIMQELKLCLLLSTNWITEPQIEFWKSSFFESFWEANESHVSPNSASWSPYVSTGPGSQRLPPGDCAAVGRKTEAGAEPQRAQNSRRTLLVLELRLSVNQLL